MSKRLKVLTITAATVVLMGVVFVGVAFAADSSSQLPACCANQSSSACSGYCSANGGVCQPGNCVANCPGSCNSSNTKTLPGTPGCCTGNSVQQSAASVGGCCGGPR